MRAAARIKDESTGIRATIQVDGRGYKKVESTGRKARVEEGR